MRRHHILAALLVLVLAACGQSSSSTPPRESGDGDPQGDWQLVEGTVDGAEVPIFEDHRITLSLEGSRIGGTSACNSYGGTLAVGGGRLPHRGPRPDRDGLRGRGGDDGRGDLHERARGG